MAIGQWGFARVQNHMQKPAFLMQSIWGTPCTTRTIDPNLLAFAQRSLQLSTSH